MSGNKTAMETIMRVIEANQDNMKEGEYLEAMNALRDLHRNQERDEDAITLPFRVQTKRDMINLWKWVCVPPSDADGDRWFTSAKETMEGWIDETTLEDLNEWKYHYELHHLQNKGEEFEWCEDCSTCLTCTACQCCGSESEEEEEEEEEWGTNDLFAICLECHNPLYDILQRTGTVNCSCETPCMRLSEYNELYPVGDGYQRTCPFAEELECDKCKRWWFYKDDSLHVETLKDEEVAVTCHACFMKENTCVGCGSTDVKFRDCGGERGCSMCEKCFN